MFNTINPPGDTSLLLTVVQGMRRDPSELHHPSAECSYFQLPLISSIGRFEVLQFELQTESV